MKRQRGVALLTALLIVALATIAAVGITRDQQLNLRRAENLLHGDQAYLYALGVENWGRGVVAKDSRRDLDANLRLDGLNEAWNLALPQTTVEGGAVSGRIEDLQGRFNLNNLVSAADAGPGFEQAQLAYLQRLLQRLELNPALAQAIADWLDTDVDTRFPGGAEDLVYMRAEPPYRAANLPMQDSSELMLVQGITPDVYQRLAPYVVALPQPTRVNVNTAPLPVLAALADNLDPGALESAMVTRQTEPFQAPDAFLSAIGLAVADETVGVGNRALAGQSAQSIAESVHNQPSNADPAQTLGALIGVSSDYFLVHARARIDRIEMRLDSVIARGETAGPRVLSRTRLPY